MDIQNNHILKGDTFKKNIIFGIYVKFQGGQMDFQALDPPLEGEKLDFSKDVS